MSEPAPAPAPPRPRDRRAHLLRRRRRAALACLLGPGLLALFLDVIRRPERVFGFDAPHAAAYWMASALVVVLWAALLTAAAVRRGRVRQIAAGVLTVLFAFSFGVQAAFFHRYNVYASFDTTYYSASFPLATVASFPQGVALTLAPVILFAAIAVALVARTRTVFRPRGALRRWSPVVAALLVVAGFALPVSYRANIQSSPPTLIYFHSLSFGAGERIRSFARPEKPTLVRVQRRSPEAVPPLVASPPAPRNVLFLLQESQRADMTCSAHVKTCSHPTRATNDLLPRRLPFLKMRAAASSTAVAISNLWAGVDPMESFARLHSTPLVWEYAHAAGYDTAYWTSQNLQFGNARLYVQDLPLSHFATGTNLDPTCDTLVGAPDEKLSDHVIAAWSELREPFFAVVHYSNLHKPRLVDPERSPFKPTSAEKSVRREEGKNHYRNAVHLSDLAVAKLIAHVRSTPAGARTVIVYTADHGEALLDHQNENDHSSTLFEEEIRVPAWIDAPEPTLSATVRRALASKKNEHLVQYDLAATLVDLLGLWDSPGFAPFRERFIGHPLTRPGLYGKPVPLTNVSWLWEYHLPNWGMMLGSKKVMALAEDESYRCYDVEKDPKEAHDLGEEACPELVAAAKARFPILPRDMLAHMRSRPDIWGPWPPSPAQ